VPPAVPPDLPLGFAHRGARAEARDNTLPSFARALELGARGLESDAWVTADGVAVLDHDGLVREGWRRRPIGSVRAADLPAHIPRLADLYTDLGTAFHLSLDLKDPAAAPAVVEVAASMDALDRLWLCSKSPDLLVSWRAQWKQAQCRQQWEKVHLVASTVRSLLPVGTLGQMAEGGVDVVNLREREWDRPLLDAVHAAGLLAFGWGAQSERQLDRLLDLGVDAVYSDHVGRMEHALARHRLRN
jgi:glycerophosphoryl diester phosphodiesterase